MACTCIVYCLLSKIGQEMDLDEFVLMIIRMILIDLGMNSTFLLHMQGEWIVSVVMEMKSDVSRLKV